MASGSSLRAAATLEVIDPSTERSVGVISLGSRADLDRAVAAARQAFAGLRAMVA